MAVLRECDVLQGVYVRVPEHDLARQRMAFLLDLSLVRSPCTEQQHEELQLAQPKGVCGLLEVSSAKDVIGDMDRKKKMLICWEM